VTGRRV